jgi:hypothetical protein
MKDKFCNNFLIKKNKDNYNKMVSKMYNKQKNNFLLKK